jgi:hypothetical protein
MVIKMAIKGSKTMIQANPLKPLEQSQFKTRVQRTTKTPLITRVNALMRLKMAMTKKIKETTK